MLSKIYLILVDHYYTGTNVMAPRLAIGRNVVDLKITIHMKSGLR